MRGKTMRGKTMRGETIESIQTYDREYNRAAFYVGWAVKPSLALDIAHPHLG